MPDLTPDQSRALAEIKAVMARGVHHLLDGPAGTGKTYLMQRVVEVARDAGKSVVLTAPTHKAVAVLQRKMREAGIEVECRTIQSLLSLRPKADGDRQIFVRDKSARPVIFDVVVIDEASMLSSDLMRYIRRHLPLAFVLFVGDPAQLPPVGEEESEAFSIKSRSELRTVVRQSADNPVLEAAWEIRRGQGGPIDWSWVRERRAPPKGVYMPGDRLDAWMRKAFTSPDYDSNPDRFRYLAWTNDRVAQMNARIRAWRYGERIPTPFMPGERALFRAPVILDDVQLFANNEEARVAEIRRDTYRYPFPNSFRSEGWVAEVPSWRIGMNRDGEEGTFDVHMPASDEHYARVIARITDEAKAGDRERWEQLHQFKVSMANLQQIYALTTHKSQGSTFGNVFVDVPDIRRSGRDNPLPMQQMLYVAATRPTDALILAGV